MGGYAPSPQFREIADYMLEQAEATGLEGVRLEEFPSEGERYYWAFRTEPSWDARCGSLWQVSPHEKRLTDFVSAEFTPVPTGHVAEFFSVLEKAGVVGFEK